MSLLLESDFFYYLAVTLVFSALAYLGGMMTTLASVNSREDEPSRTVAPAVSLGLVVVVALIAAKLGGDFWRVTVSPTELVVDRSLRSSVTIPKAELQSIVDVDLNKESGNHVLELHLTGDRVLRSVIQEPAQIKRVAGELSQWSGLAIQERQDS